VPFVDALDDWVRARPTQGVRLTVGALAVAVTSGGSPARGLDGVAATLRARNEVEREVRALATQARTSAAVMAAAPVGFAVVGVLGDSGAAAFLFGSAGGWACLLAGLLLDALGAWWMARIARGPG
jgi:tight adherence protein B